MISADDSDASLRAFGVGELASVEHYLHAEIHAAARLAEAGEPRRRHPPIDFPRTALYRILKQKSLRKFKVAYPRAACGRIS
jgi:hypothetical protein